MVVGESIIKPMQVMIRCH